MKIIKINLWNQGIHDWKWSIRLYILKTCRIYKRSSVSWQTGHSMVKNTARANNAGLQVDPLTQGVATTYNSHDDTTQQPDTCLYYSFLLFFLYKLTVYNIKSQTCILKLRLGDQASRHSVNNARRSMNVHFVCIAKPPPHCFDQMVWNSYWRCCRRSPNSETVTRVVTLDT
jgi:hypothetical protein